MKSKAKTLVVLTIVAVTTVLIWSIWHFSLFPLILNPLKVASSLCYRGIVRIGSLCYRVGVSIYEEMLSSFPIALPYVLTISIFIAGLFLADRERHVHGFRNADLNFFEQATYLNVTKATSEKEILVKMGKMWLKVSEHLRQSAVYLSFSAVHMILAAWIFVISLILLSVDKHYTVLTTCVGFVFFLLSFAGHFGRYGYGKRKLGSWWSFYKRFSWKICNGFPPLAPPLILSHLARWREIGEAIQQEKRFMSYLEKVDEYKDLEEITEYIEPQKEPFFRF